MGTINPQLFADYVARRLNSIITQKRKDYSMSDKDSKYLNSVIAMQCPLSDQVVSDVNEILCIAENKSTPYYNTYVSKIHRKGLDFDLLSNVCGIDSQTLLQYAETSPEQCNPLLQKRLMDAIDSFYGDNEIYISYFSLITKDDAPLDELSNSLGIDYHVVTDYAAGVICPTADIMRSIVDYLSNYTETPESITSVRNKVIATLHGYMISSNTIAHKLRMSESEAQDVLDGRTPCTIDLAHKLQGVIRDCVDRTHTEFKPEKYFSYRVDNISAININEMLTCKNPVQCENLLLKVLEDE